MLQSGLVTQGGTGSPTNVRLTQKTIHKGGFQPAMYGAYRRVVHGRLKSALQGNHPVEPSHTASRQSRSSNAVAMRLMNSREVSAGCMVGASGGWPSVPVHQASAANICWR